jgi:hypothetical protein
MQGQVVHFQYLSRITPQARAAWLGKYQAVAVVSKYSITFG